MKHEPETVIQLSKKQMALCAKMSHDAVEYFRVKKANGRSNYKLYTDADADRRFQQTMCGVMAEFATSLYLDTLGIRHTATIMSHAKKFNQETYALPDFEVWLDGKRVFLEVKST